jgi:RNA polymerase sigma factor (sigma-70 family)
MGKCSQVSLKTLVEMCQAGKADAWHQLIDLVGPAIFAVCRKRRLSRDESFDIFGQVCLQLIDAIGSLKTPEKIIAFVVTITRRQIYTFYQRMQLVERLDPDELGSRAEGMQDDPESIYENTRNREILLEAMSKLSERDYKLIELLFLDPEEPSYEEIARRLGTPVSSIGPIRAKALEKLKRILRQKRFRI